MYKKLKKNKSKSFRMLRGLTQAEVAARINTGKSNVANAEADPDKIVGSKQYALIYGVSELEYIGATPRYSIDVLSEPISLYRVYGDDDADEYPEDPIENPRKAHKEKKERKRSAFGKNKRYKIPKKYVNHLLLREIPASKVLRYTAAVLKDIADRTQPGSIHNVYALSHRMFETDYLIWRANRDIPAAGIFSGQPVLIRPQPYYHTGALVLCSRSAHDFFIGKVTKAQRYMYDIQDSKQKKLSLEDNTIEIYGRMWMAYTLF